ncbi:hypothetical protein JOC70_001228 [Clostridium pascui]|uniref:ABC transporter permease n=1 Tax=Clostridium pascui TaxID=46609 RepID=UPI0019570FFC|nr:ABC transporter permease [Clostridium pascui]MBM7869758.1 hypothetical protein [Clostridium pascui]
MREFCQLLKGEFLKQRKSFTWAIAILTPVLAAGLTFINLFIRYDYLMSLEANKGASPWNMLLLQHHFIWFLLFSLVVTIFASMVNYIEYKSNSWKNTLALPVSRNKVYLSKWFLVYILSIIMIFFNGILLVIVGKILGFREAVDLTLILKYELYQMAAVTSLISLQCFISAEISNTNISLTIGAVGVASSMFFAQSKIMSKLIPYAHIIYSLPDSTIDNTITLQYGLSFGIVFLIIGTFFFNKKEIC